MEKKVKKMDDNLQKTNDNLSKLDQKVKKQKEQNTKFENMIKELQKEMKEMESRPPVIIEKQINSSVSVSDDDQEMNEPVGDLPQPIQNI